MKISFSIPAVPVAQPRQRHRIVTAGGGTFARNYTPTKDPVNAFKATARLVANGHFPLAGWDFSAPMRLSATFVFPRLGKHKAKKYGIDRIRKTSKPDLDNLLKSLKDSLTGLVWNDDAQVCTYYSVTKFYAAVYEQPHVQVEIETLET